VFLAAFPAAPAADPAEKGIPWFWATVLARAELVQNEKDADALTYLTGALFYTGHRLMQHCGAALSAAAAAIETGLPSQQGVVHQGRKNAAFVQSHLVNMVHISVVARHCLAGKQCLLPAGEGWQQQLSIPPSNT
jgi:hypothetical protein